ncbi:MAG TPA: hypothetical protein PKE45_08925 [Caldilineaceae bacterium]|nr:hypothetical protein [Caldilineaceae bacterium]
MTWTVSVINNSARSLVAPSPGVNYVEKMQASIFVKTLGCITLLDVGAQPGGSHTWAVDITSGFQTQRWWYDGGGACVLTINADDTFTLTGQDQTLSGPIGGPIGVGLDMPSSDAVYLMAFSNAGYQQRLVLTVDGGDRSYCFQGSGEPNVRIPDRYTQNIDIAFTPPVTADGVVRAWVSMENSSDGGTTWRESLYAPLSAHSVASYESRILLSDDAGGDGDFQDLVLYVHWWSPPG